MSNYIATDYVSSTDTVANAAAALETYLETIDSTTQKAWLIKIVEDFDHSYKAVVLHLDT